MEIKGKVQKYKGFLATVILSLIYLLIHRVIDLDFFEAIINFIAKYEKYELDEFIFVLCFIFLGGGFDFLMYRLEIKHQRDLNSENVETLKATMRNVFDVTGNFFNKLMLYKLEIEETGSLTKESVDDLDRLMVEASQKLDEISRLEKIVKKRLIDNVYILDLDKKE